MLRIVFLEHNEMFVGGNKPQKIQKTKFRKNSDSERYSNQHKHHDKSTYRLLKQEEEYELENRTPKRN
jgi:hypothetical protein